MQGDQVWLSTLPKMPKARKRVRADTGKSSWMIDEVAWLDGGRSPLEGSSWTIPDPPDTWSNPQPPP